MCASWEEEEEEERAAAAADGGPRDIRTLEAEVGYLCWEEALRNCIPGPPDTLPLPLSQAG